MSIKEAAVERIKELCSERNITTNTLANLAGITPSTVYSILEPGRKDIGIVVIKKLCDGLDIGVKEFFNAAIFEGLQQEIN